MKKVWMLIVLAALVIAPAAMALEILNITRVSGYYTGSGGEFTVLGTPYLANYVGATTAYSSYFQGTGFQTFCLELSEEIYPPATYQYELNSAAIAGGVGGGINGDPLSVGTCWLYSQFAAGVLANYNYSAGSGRAADAGKLQNVIWWLEQEASDPGSGNEFRQAILGAFGTITAARADAAAGYLGVYAMNLYNSYGERRQDVLVMNPPVQVPDGGLTLLMLGASVMGCVALRRRLAS